MKNKNRIIAIIVTALIIISDVVAFLIIRNYDKNAFSVEENKWIDENKNKLIDIYLLNEVPVLNYNGAGLTFDFLTDIEKNLNLKFNKNAYKLDDKVNQDYMFRLTSKAGKNDILILRDNYVLVTKSDTVYSKVTEMNNLNIGILKSEEAVIKEYYSNIDLTTSKINFITFDTYTELMNELSLQNGKINGIIILKTLYTNHLIEDDDLNISYHYSNLTSDFVLTINNNDILLSILKKQYEKWQKENFEEKYNYYLLNSYFSVKQISDMEQKNLQSVKFKYAFIENGIYDNLSSSTLSGINKLILKDFSDFAQVSVEYEESKSIDNLVNDFNSSKIDIFFDTVEDKKYSIDHYQTKSIMNAEYAVISNINNNIVVNSIKDLKGESVLTIKSSSAEKYLKDNKISIKSYDNLTKLLENKENNDVIIIDLNNFEYYKASELVNYKIDFIFELGKDYSFIINNKKDNKVFANLFDFYVSYANVNKTINSDYTSIVEEKKSYYLHLIIVIIILIIIIGITMFNRIKQAIKEFKKNKKFDLPKEDKLKYIDQLTSLKNRAYLNSRIEEWDDSEVYPQAIVIIDLNNVAYINDNYGREEGDKVITEAANILILSQLPNSEIIRTDGNEFLIYLVGYEEKQIISYLRKLTRSFKSLSHGFGAATGYSIIKNGIKTIDDAVNEATLDMKNNKEDIEY